MVNAELANAQPATVILKLFKLAVRVIQYQDRVRLHLPAGCAVQALLQKVTERLFLAAPTAPSSAQQPRAWPPTERPPMT